MSTFTLIGSPTCPYVQRVAIALNEKHVDFDQLDVDLAEKPEWFLAVSPLGKVPVLRIERDGEPPAALFESVAILEYIEETVPGERLYADDPLKRAQQRAWVEFGSTVLGDLRRFSTAVDETSLTAARGELHQKLKRLESVCGAGPYFAGQHFSLVDAAFAPALRQIRALDSMAGIGLLDGFPGLEQWSRSLGMRESVRRAVPDDYVNRYLAGLRAINAVALDAAA